MLPPMLFYGLASALLFFGVLRVGYLGVLADRRSPAKREIGSDNADSSEEPEELIEGESRQERYRRPPRMGFGLVSMMGLGRMSPAKRHTVMGGLWIVLGLYMAWTGYSVSRKQAQEVSDAPPRVRVIRADVAPPAQAPPPAELNAPANTAPAEPK